MNKKINYGSFEEIIAFSGPRIGIVAAIGLKATVEMMEAYDPGGKKAHELAKKYQKK
jgi:hypothetical protein